MNPWEWKEPIDHSTSVSSLFKPRGFSGESRFVLWGKLQWWSISWGSNWPKPGATDPDVTAAGISMAHRLRLVTWVPYGLDWSSSCPLVSAVIPICYYLRASFNEAYAPSFVWRLEVEFHLSNGGEVKDKFIFYGAWCIPVNETWDIVSQSSRKLPGISVAECKSLHSLFIYFKSDSGVCWSAQYGRYRSRDSVNVPIKIRMLKFIFKHGIFAGA